MFIRDMYIHRRKQCLHCGCARSTHNVESDPFSVIPLLEELSVGQKSSKLTRADVDRLAKYAWYPPGVSYGMVRYLLSYVDTGSCRFLINPRRACAGGLRYLSCVCVQRTLEGSVVKNSGERSLHQRSGRSL